MTKQFTVLIVCAFSGFLNFGQQVIDVSSLNPKLQNKPLLRVVEVEEDSLYLGGNLAYINGNTVNPIVKVGMDGGLSRSFNFNMPYTNNLQNELSQPHLFWKGFLHIQYQGEIRRINKDGSFDDSFSINDTPNIQFFAIHQDSLVILSNGEKLAIYGEDGGGRIITDFDTDIFSLSWLYQVDESSFFLVTSERSSGVFKLHLFKEGAVNDSFNPVEVENPGSIDNTERLENGEILIQGKDLVLSDISSNGVYIVNSEGDISENSFHDKDLSFIDRYGNGIEWVSSDGNGKFFIIGHNDTESYSNLGLAKVSQSGIRDDNFQIQNFRHGSARISGLIPAGEQNFILAADQSSYDDQPSRGINLIDIEGNVVPEFNVNPGGYPSSITSFRNSSGKEYWIEGNYVSSEPDDQPWITKLSLESGPQSTELGLQLTEENPLGASKFLDNDDFMTAYFEENTNYLKVFRDGEPIEISTTIYRHSGTRSLLSIVQSPEGIYASGSITYLDSDTFIYGMIKLDTEYNQDKDFTSPFGQDDIVRRVFLQDDNKLVVQVNRIQESKIEIIRLMPDGTEDDTFSKITFDNNMLPPVFEFYDSLYMTYNVDFNDDQSIKVYDSNGILMNNQLFTIDADREIHDIQLISDSTFLIAGNFQFVNRIPRKGLAILGTNGNLYNDIDLDIAGNVSQIEVSGDTLFSLGSASIDGNNTGGFFAIRLVAGTVEISTIENDSEANVAINWELNPNVRTVEVLQVSGENVVSSGILQPDVTSYTFESTLPNIDYTYQILASNLFGRSESASVSYEIVKPDTPTNLTAERQDQIVILNWEDPSDNETGFSIYRAENGGDFELLTMTEPNVVMFSDETTSELSGYVYTVEASSENFRSDRSNEAIVDIILGIENQGKAMIYPNPSDGKVEISTNEIIEQIKILDFSGRLIKSYQVGQKHWIKDLKHIKKGAYMIQIHHKKDIGIHKLILTDFIKN